MHRPTVEVESDIFFPSAAAKNTQLFLSNGEGEGVFFGRLLQDFLICKNFPESFSESELSMQKF
jgi:hypothetical protein